MAPFFKQINTHVAVVLLLSITGTALWVIPYMNSSDYPDSPRCLHHQMAGGDGDDCGMENCPMHYTKNLTSQSKNYRLACPQPEILFLAFNDLIVVLPVVYTLAQPNPAVKLVELHAGAEIASYKSLEAPPPKS